MRHLFRDTPKAPQRKVFCFKGRELKGLLRLARLYQEGRLES